MKIISQIFLVLFIAFLVTPTIVTVIQKSTDMSVFYSVTEEEHVQKEIKNFFYFESFLGIVLSLKLVLGIISSANLLNLDSISSSIFIPPPNET